MKYYVILNKYNNVIGYGNVNKEVTEAYLEQQLNNEKHFEIVEVISEIGILLKKQKEICSKTIYGTETYLIPQEKIALENSILNAPEPEI